MTTDTEALICDCPAKNMPFGRCCKLEPLTALRAAFESTVSEWGWDTYRNKAGDYATTSTHGAWAAYQAGHAAAKAETAAAVAKERERPSITLTTLEIADLAKFAGLLCGLPNRESREDQVTIEPCPEDGLRDDDEGEIWSSSWIAYMTEYPEEGSVTLGNTIRAEGEGRHHQARRPRPAPGPRR